MSTLEMKQGDTWSVEVVWCNPIAGTYRPDPDNPIDITGYTARLQIRRSLNDNEDPMLDLTEGDGLTIDGEAGSITARATPTQTAAVSSGSCYWEIEISNDDDNYTIDSGLIVVERQLS